MVRRLYSAQSRDAIHRGNARVPGRPSPPERYSSGARGTYVCTSERSRAAAAPRPPDEQAGRRSNEMVGGSAQPHVHRERTVHRRSCHRRAPGVPRAAYFFVGCGAYPDGLVEFVLDAPAVLTRPSSYTPLGCYAAWFALCTRSDWLAAHAALAAVESENPEPSMLLLWKAICAAVAGNLTAIDELKEIPLCQRRVRQPSPGNLCAEGGE